MREVRFGRVRLEEREVLLKQRRVIKGQRPRERTNGSGHGSRQIDSIVMAEDIATSSGESAYTEEEVTEEEENGRTSEGGRRTDIPRVPRKP